MIISHFYEELKLPDKLTNVYLVAFGKMNVLIVLEIDLSKYYLNAGYFIRNYSTGLETQNSH